VKRSLPTVVLIVISVLVGWFAHWAFTYDPQTGLQWQFVAAAKRGDVGSLERCFAQGAVINAEPSNDTRDEFGFPALLEAADAGQPDTVAWLLAHGADPNQQTSDSWPLAAAERRIIEATKTVELLKKHGAKNLYP
jgi:ankyrin repeat protein